MTLSSSRAQLLPTSTGYWATLCEQHLLQPLTVTLQKHKIVLNNKTRALLITKRKIITL